MKEVVEALDGMLYDEHSENHWETIEDAVERIVDDYWSPSEKRYILDSLPEYLVCCELRAPRFSLGKNHFYRELEGLIQNIDESEEGSANDGDTYFSEGVDENKMKILEERMTEACQKVLDDWMENVVQWKLWYPCNKYI